jgi:hypothetical protein
MTIKIGVILKAAGIFALLIIGAGLMASGSIIENNGVKEAGSYLLGIGLIIVFIFAFLSFSQKKNYFK